MRSAALHAVAAAWATLALAAPAAPATAACPGTHQYRDSTSSLCQQCPSSMLTCSSATVAITCQRGRYLTAEKHAADETFDPASQTCKGSAASCAASGDHFFNAVTNFCEPLCQKGTLVDGVYTQALRYVYGLDRCMPCGQQGAVACDYLGRPTSCFEGYHDGDGWCAKCTDDQIWNTEIKNCECQGAAYTSNSDGKLAITRKAKYQDPNTNAQSCITCPDSFTALTCKGQGTGGVSTSCLPDYKLVDGSCNHCASDNQVFQPATGECKEVTCPAATYTLGENGNAYNVKPAQRLEASTGTCVACDDAYARSCGSTGKAISCLPPYNLGADGTCIRCSVEDQTVFDPETRTCKLKCRGYAIWSYDGGSLSLGTIYERANRMDETTGTCVNCDDPNAQLCDAIGYTTTCIVGYVLFNGHCYQCPSSSGHFNTETVFCEPRCEAGFVNQWGYSIWAEYYDYTTQNCERCQHENAMDCDSNGNAISCLSGWRLSNGECVR
ncbi:hypothetical protein JCM3770_005448 [Rhodotorula araucariae]